MQCPIFTIVYTLQMVGHDVNIVPADHRIRSTELSHVSVRIGALRTTKMTFLLVLLLVSECAARSILRVRVR